VKKVTYSTLNAPLATSTLHDFKNTLQHQIDYYLSQTNEINTLVNWRCFLCMEYICATNV